MTDVTVRWCWLLWLLRFFLEAYDFVCTLWLVPSAGGGIHMRSVLHSFLYYYATAVTCCFILVALVWVWLQLGGYLQEHPSVQWFPGLTGSVTFQGKYSVVVIVQVVGLLDHQTVIVPDADCRRWFGGLVVSKLSCQVVLSSCLVSFGSLAAELSDNLAESIKVSGIAVTTPLEVLLTRIADSLKLTPSRRVLSLLVESLPLS